MSRGFTLIELMVACALGLGLTAAAAQLFAGQVRAQREQLVETRLQQDLRAAADLVVRGLRRAGHHGPIETSAYREITVSGPQLGFAHSRDTAENGVLDERERAGFRVAEGTLQARVGGRWQALSDPAVIRVTGFEVHLDTPSVPAPAACGRLVSRSLRFTLEAHPIGDPAKLRRTSGTVQVRNDDPDTAACERARE